MRRAAIGLVIAVCASSPAAAQPGAAQAEVLFDRGKQLMRAGKTAEACAAFDSSQKLDPQVTTLLNIADCREKNGQLATAWGAFVEAERQTRSSSAKLNETATARARKLEARLSKLTIRVPHRRPGLVVLRDGQPVDAAAFDVALPVDGGTIEIAARAPGHQPFVATVRLGIERDQQTVTIGELARDARQPLLSPPKLKAEPQPVRTARPAPARSRALPIAFGAAAVALAGGAVGLELWSRAKYDASLDEPDDAKQEALWKAANARRYGAVGAGAVAAACAAASIYLFVRSPGRESPTRVAPVAGSGLTGLVVVGSF